MIAAKGIERSEIIMAGDRLHKDIAMANNAGTDSLFVLSGDTSRNDVEAQPNLATYVLNDISKIK